MLGAIIGDIVGSVYEWHNIKIKEFPFFRDDCHFTDDTVMTIAVAEAMMNGGAPDDFIDAMKKFGKLYPDVGYGRGFKKWLSSDSREPYNSYGNGSAMRVSPVGFFPNLRAAHGYFDMSLGASIYGLSAHSAEVTHNHPEGVKGAQAVADSIVYMRIGREVDGDVVGRRVTLKDFIEERYGYDLSRTLDETRPTYKFNETCQGTVPQAIRAFIESTDFEDAIRNAISLGGDSDTLAAITGGIAEAAYGVPPWIKDKAWRYLDGPLKDVCRRWRKFIRKT